MTDSRKRADLDFYMNVTDSVNGPAMTWGMAMIGYLSLGDSAESVQELFKKSYLNAQGDFNVWLEVPYGGAVNFITGAGGFLQTIPFGWGGMRIYDDNLSFQPQLAPSCNKMKLRGVSFHGAKIDIEWDDESVFLVNNNAEAVFNVKTTDGNVELSNDQPLKLKRSEFEISLMNKAFA